MGVPVVTLAGRTHVSRVGASLLTHLGAPEWVGLDAGRLRPTLPGPGRGPAAAGRDPGGLRGGWSGPLCDGPGFARRLERRSGRCGAGNAKAPDQSLAALLSARTSPRVPPASAPAWRGLGGRDWGESEQPRDR